MILRELRYVVAVARERHFWRAAEKCCVSQPKLSLSVKKLESEPGITIVPCTAAGADKYSPRLLSVRRFAGEAP